MPFNDHSEYPKGRFHAEDVTNSPRDVFTGPGKVSGVHLRGGTNAVAVILRANDASPVYFNHDIGTTPVSVYLPVNFYAEDGLEVLTSADSGGDVEVTVFYYAASSTVG